MPNDEHETQIIENADGLTENTSSYIFCLEHFADHLFYCQQFPCESWNYGTYEHEDNFSVNEHQSYHTKTRRVMHKYSQTSNRPISAYYNNITERQSFLKSNSEQYTPTIESVTLKPESQEQPPYVESPPMDVTEPATQVPSSSFPQQSQRPSRLEQIDAGKSEDYSAISMKRRKQKHAETGFYDRSILRRPLSSPISRYDGFYSEYCKSLCQCKPCFTCPRPRFDFIESFLMEKDHDTRCAQFILCPRGKCIQNDEKCKSSKGAAHGISKCTLVNKPCRPCPKSSKRAPACGCEPMTEAFRKIVCDPEDVHVLESNPTRRSTSPVAFTSTIMVLFFVMITIYTVGINTGEYVTYKLGLHGRTFFLLPYTLRSLTIGFTLMSDFLSYLLCPPSPGCQDLACRASTRGFLDLASRTLVFSFLADAVWNAVEWAMERHQVSPLLYFSASVSICLLAMYSFFKFAKQNT